jgi:DNA-binding transcriptional LysR family regulator
MDFRQLQYMLKVVEEKSISRAAKKLYIAQPSLSQYILTLEQQLGVKLFDRTTTPLELTYAGELYAETARRILDLRNQLSLQMDDIANLKRGHIHLGISPFRSTYFLPLLLPTFKQRYPGIEITLEEGTMAELTEMALNGTTDFSIMTLPVKEDVIEYEPIMTEEILLALPPHHPLSEDARMKLTAGLRPRICLAALNEEPFIMLKPGQRLRQCAFDLCRKAGFKPKIVLETKSMEAAHALVSAGMGATFMPGSLVCFGKILEKPTYFSLEDPVPERTLVVAYRKGRYLSNAARELITLIKEVIPASGKNG